MFVAREHELATLNAAYADAIAGRGSVVFVTGEAGLGKTTLIHEWRSRIDSNNDALAPIFAEAMCSVPVGGMGSGSVEALQPWADIVASIARQTPQQESTSTDEAAPAKHKRRLDLRKLFHDAAPAWGWALPVVGDVAHAAFETLRLAREQREATGNVDKKKLVRDAASTWALAVPLVGGAAHAALETSRIAAEQRAAADRSTLAANQEQVFQQYANALGQVAEAQPLIVFLDDVHWADESSVQLLLHAARLFSRSRILVLATYRRDDVLTARGGQGHPVIAVRDRLIEQGLARELTLGTFDRTAVSAYLRQSFDRYVANVQLEEWLVRISSGNALFVSQFIKTLAEDGWLNADGAFVGAYEAVAIPPSAIAVIEERARRLDDDTRDVLSMAAVEGEEFTAYLLAALSGLDAAALAAALGPPLEQELIAERGAVEVLERTLTAQFGFSHALFVRALYESLLLAQRNRLHRACFTVFKAEWDRLGDASHRPRLLTTKLLVHAEKCREWRYVADAALSSAREAWSSFAEPEAMQHLDVAERALGALAESGKGDATWTAGTRGEVLYLRALIHNLRGRFDESIDVFAAARTAFIDAERWNRAVYALTYAASANRVLSRLDESQRLANEALDLARRHHDLDGEASALNSLGLLHRSLGNAVESKRFFDRSLELRLQIGDIDGEALVRNNMGVLHGTRGEMDSALAQFERSLELVTQLGNQPRIATTLNNVGMVHSGRGEWDAALDCHRQCLTMRRTIGDREGEAASLNNIGTTFADRGDFEAALPYYKEALAMRIEIGDRSGEAQVLNNIGSVFVFRKDYLAAKETHERALAIRMEIADEEGEALSLLNLSSVHRQLGTFEVCRTMIFRGLAIDEVLDNHVLDGNFHCELGLLAEAEAKLADAQRRMELLREAREHIEHGMQLLTKLGSPDVEDYQRDLERLRMNRG